MNVLRTELNPKKKKEKTELHEQKRKLERDLLKNLMKIGGVNK